MRYRFLAEYTYDCLIFSNCCDVMYQIRHRKTRGNLFGLFLEVPPVFSDLSF